MTPFALVQHDDVRIDPSDNPIESLQQFSLNVYTLNRIQSFIMKLILFYVNSTCESFRVNNFVASWLISSVIMVFFEHLKV